MNSSVYPAFLVGIFHIIKTTRIRKIELEMDTNNPYKLN
ncbi:hypothetical protein QF049_005498 [Paenibacillus sp. W4I10]|nr:hypothetical protein [Paenibacillus sp. W4I10]